jgi:hypothetical protein
MTQFAILNIERDFYLQDVNIAYPSRIKLGPESQISLFKNALIDIGNAVLYKVDKITYRKEPVKSNSNGVTTWGK